MGPGSGGVWRMVSVCWEGSTCLCLQRKMGFGLVREYLLYGCFVRVGYDGGNLICRGDVAWGYFLCMRVRSFVLCILVVFEMGFWFGCIIWIIDYALYCFFTAPAERFYTTE